MTNQDRITELEKRVAALEERCKAFERRMFPFRMITSTKGTRPTVIGDEAFFDMSGQSFTIPRDAVARGEFTMGGVVKGPVKAIIGEHGPELIINEKRDGGIADESSK